MKYRRMFTSICDMSGW